MKVKKPVKTALLLILFAVCLNAAVNHLDVVGRSMAHFFGLLSPILIGFLTSGCNFLYLLACDCQRVDL